MRPFNAQLEGLRALKGEPKISYPEGHLDYPLIERVTEEARTKTPLAFLSADPDPAHPNALLVAQVETRGDRQIREMYRQWRTLPGPVLLQVEDDAETNSPALIGQQAILKPSSFPQSRVIGAVTADADDDTLTLAAHGLPAGLCVRVSTTGTLPAGLSAATNYWIVNPTADTLQLSATVDGSAINLTTAGTGTHSLLWGDGTKLGWQPRGVGWGIQTIQSLLRWKTLAVQTVEFERYSVPTMLYGLNGSSSVTEGRDGTVRVELNFDKRAAYNPVVPMVVTQQYGPPTGADALAQDAIFDPTPVDIDIQGPLFAIRVGHCLTAGFSVSANTSTDNPKYPYVTQTSVVDASATTPAVFAGAHIISSPITPWKYGLNRRRRVTATLP